jgi:hypothetical protein
MTTLLINTAENTAADKIDLFFLVNSNLGAAPWGVWTVLVAEVVVRVATGLVMIISLRSGKTKQLF